MKTILSLASLPPGSTLEVQLTRRDLAVLQGLQDGESFLFILDTAPPTQPDGAGEIKLIFKISDAVEKSAKP